MDMSYGYVYSLWPDFRDVSWLRPPSLHSSPDALQEGSRMSKANRSQAPVSGLPENNGRLPLTTKGVSHWSFLPANMWLRRRMYRTRHSSSRSRCATGAV